MKKQTVKIKYSNQDTPRLQEIKQGDCIDLYIDSIDEITNEYFKVSFGVAMKLPKGYIAKIYPRSSTYKRFHLLLSNSVGIIDNSYSGDNDVWRGIFIRTNKKTKLPGKGDRIAQFEIVPSMKMKTWRKLVHLLSSSFNFKEVDHLDSKSRGGFGSTGK